MKIKEALSPRERTSASQPKWFRLSPPAGRQRPAELYADLPLTDLGSLQNTAGTRSYQDAVRPGNRQGFAVAWRVSEAERQGPFTISYRDGPPVKLPSLALPPPPERKP